MKNKRYFLFLAVILFLFVIFYYLNIFFQNSFTYTKETRQNEPFKKADTQKSNKDFLEENNLLHIDRPKNLKAVYFTMWSFLTPQKREYFLNLKQKFNLNALVVDFKNSNGDLIFENAKNLKELIRIMHENDIYMIARIAVFQDNNILNHNKDIALKDKNGEFWRDYKGNTWIDPTKKESWDYVLSIAQKAIDYGFDEINFDYIRFPTDGELSNMDLNLLFSKEEYIKKFSNYAFLKLKEYNPNIYLSIDIFGYSFLREDGLGIGQRVSDLIDNFDYVYPMLYPSHYSKGNFGYDNPANYPYEVISLTLKRGIDILRKSSKEDQINKINPWLQAFDLGANYSKEMVDAQIKAVYDVLGSNAGWLLWSPLNNYDKAFGF